MVKHIDPDSLIQDMADRVDALQLPSPLIVGIHSGGVWIAERLHSLTGNVEELSALDISFYRDDFSRVGLNPEVRSSSIPVSVEDRNIILVDDVLHTGRTIRAGLNEIFSYGRPARVVLCVMIERSGRELPIQADIVGMHLDLGDNENVKLTNPDGKLEAGIFRTEPGQ